MKIFSCRVLVVAGVVSLMSVATGFSAGQCTGNAKDIVDTAVAAGKFKTLAAALTAADLVETLKGTGPFTVFAPTDEAFAKLPEEHSCRSAEAREQGQANCHPHLPCRPRKGHGCRCR